MSGHARMGSFSILSASYEIQIEQFCIFVSWRPKYIQVRRTSMPEYGDSQGHGTLTAIEVDTRQVE